MAGLGKRTTARVKEWLMEYAYLVTLFSVIAVVAAAAIYTEQIKAQQQESLHAAAQASEIADHGEAAAVTPLPTIVPAPTAIAQVSYRPRIAVVRPVSGDILRPYSTQPVYWEALGMWRAHEAIDLAGEKDEAVLCAMDGVVERTVMDALWGWRVSVANTDGSIGVYAGLGLSYVQPGQHVTRGQAIGVLMEEIPCEAELGPHLHFELITNTKAQDPEGILPE